MNISRRVNEQQLLAGFCARHTIPVPGPDKRNRYHLGFDDVEMELFEDLGKLYLVTELIQLPDTREERERIIREASTFMFKYLYVDDCILNLDSKEKKEYLVLVTSITDPDDTELDGFEARIEALINRTEELIMHLKQTSQTTVVPNRLSIFKP